MSIVEKQMQTAVSDAEERADALDQTMGSDTSLIAPPAVRAPG